MTVQQFKKEAELAASQSLKPKSQHLSDQSKLFELGKYWPLIKVALTLVMLFTGKKADAKIREIIKWGDGLFVL